MLLKSQVFESYLFRTITFRILIKSSVKISISCSKECDNFVSFNDSVRRFIRNCDDILTWIVFTENVIYLRNFNLRNHRSNIYLHANFPDFFYKGNGNYKFTTIFFLPSSFQKAFSRAIFHHFFCLPEMVLVSREKTLTFIICRFQKVSFSSKA